MSSQTPTKKSANTTPIVPDTWKSPSTAKKTDIPTRSPLQKIEKEIATQTLVAAFWEGKYNTLVRETEHLKRREYERGFEDGIRKEKILNLRNRNGSRF